MLLLPSILRQVFYRTSGPNPLKVTVWFLLVSLIIGTLALLNARQKKKARQLQLARYDRNWKDLCEKHELSEEEKQFLEAAAAQFLKVPEKKYLLLVNHQIFKACTTRYVRANDGKGERLIHSIIRKADMVPGFRKLDNIEFQRRKTHRYNVQLPCHIGMVSNDLPKIPAIILDISSGGCLMMNPNGRFKAGDDILLAFELNGKKYEALHGEVIRTSRGDQRLHISFGHTKG